MVPQTIVLTMSDYFRTCDAHGHLSGIHQSDGLLHGKLFIQTYMINYCMFELRIIIIFFFLTIF